MGIVTFLVNIDERILSKWKFALIFISNIVNPNANIIMREFIIRILVYIMLASLSPIPPISAKLLYNRASSCKHRSGHRENNRRNNFELAQFCFISRGNNLFTRVSKRSAISIYQPQLSRANGNSEEIDKVRNCTLTF